MASAASIHPKRTLVCGLAGVLEEALAQVQVVAPDALGDGSARSDDLQEIDAGPPRRHRSGDVGLGQADGGLDARRRGKAWKKGRLRRVG